MEENGSVKVDILIIGENGMMMCAFSTRYQVGAGAGVETLTHCPVENILY